MVCPVCGKNSQYVVCPECGFDSSRDYERYPTLAPIQKAPAVSALKKEWQARKPDEVLRRKRPWLALIACAAMLALGIGIGVGLSDEREEPSEHGGSIQEDIPEPWKENVLRSDTIEDIYAAPVEEYPVFGSEYRRGQIHTVTFLDSLEEAPEDAWDVSEAGDGRVLAWVIPYGEMYDLYIGAKGGVSAGESCAYLFCGYSNAVRMDNLEFLHTENVQDMGYMFYHCIDLTSLDLSSFDTSNVQDMRYMFKGCFFLTSLDLSNFDTSNVRDMCVMFYNCSHLTSLDLSSFDTSNVKYTTDMFRNCPAGSDWQHLLK